MKTIPLDTMTMCGRPSDEGRMGSGIGNVGDPGFTLTKAHSHAVVIQTVPEKEIISFQPGQLVRDFGPKPSWSVAATLRREHNDQSPHIALNPPATVRKLTPVECERLQGFPDDWTRIPYRGKDADQCPDGPRYKAIGNSMAVNVMEWIGERIDFVNGLFKETE